MEVLKSIVVNLTDEQIIDALMAITEKDLEDKSVFLSQHAMLAVYEDRHDEEAKFELMERIVL